MVKGSVAGATGIVLLMGGFGTYALWSDSATLPGSSITSGTMSISAGTPSWTDASAVGPNNWTSGDLIVPGDKIVRTQTFTVTATGRNMKGSLAFAAGAVSKGTFGNDLTVTVNVSAPGLVVDTANSAWHFTAPVGTTDVTATVTYDFASSASAAATKSATATVADGAFTLSQVRP